MFYGEVSHSDLHFIDDEEQLGGGKVFKHSDVLGKIRSIRFNMFFICASEVTNIVFNGLTSYSYPLQKTKSLM